MVIFVRYLKFLNNCCYYETELDTKFLVLLCSCEWIFHKFVELLYFFNRRKLIEKNSSTNIFELAPHPQIGMTGDSLPVGCGASSKRFLTIQISLPVIFNISFRNLLLFFLSFLFFLIHKQKLFGTMLIIFFPYIRIAAQDCDDT